MGSGLNRGYVFQGIKKKEVEWTSFSFNLTYKPKLTLQNNYDIFYYAKIRCWVSKSFIQL